MHHGNAKLFTTMLFPTGPVAIILNLISGYALKQSLTSISNIKKYEEKAEKAADWSNTAKTRLWDTRYTIGAGLVSVSTVVIQNPTLIRALRMLTQFASALSRSPQDSLTPSLSHPVTVFLLRPGDPFGP